MLVDNGTVISIIALLSAMCVIGLFLRENIRLSKEIRRLQLALRDERRKVNG